MQGWESELVGVRGFPELEIKTKLQCLSSSNLKYYVSNSCVLVDIDCISRVCKTDLHDIPARVFPKQMGSRILRFPKSLWQCPIHAGYSLAKGTYGENKLHVKGLKKPHGMDLAGSG